MVEWQVNATIEPSIAQRGALQSGHRSGIGSPVMSVCGVGRWLISLKGVIALPFYLARDTHASLAVCIRAFLPC